jgi:hypothetical protein
LGHEAPDAKIELTCPHPSQGDGICLLFVVRRRCIKGEFRFGIL